MPLLEAEPRTFPDTLLSDPETIASRGGCWWVMYTKARMEKSLARHLRSHHIGFYLPQYEHTWKANGRRRSSFLPLFPGYVFLHGDHEARLAALETNMLCTIFPVPNQDRLFDDLCRVERILGGAAPVTPEQHVPEGALVEITAGSFQGVCGKVIRRDGETRLVVEVEFLRRGVSVEVEEWALRVLDPVARKAG